MKKIYLILALVIFGNLIVNAQQKLPKAIQFTGKVVTEDSDGNVIGLPYVNVAIEGTSRGVVSEFDGYFSFVAQPGEKVVFSRIGFKTVEYVVPDTLNSDLYSWIQIMSVDNVLLPEVVIYPWPSREHFKYDLLAMDVTDEVRENARKNLAEEAMRELRYAVPTDGREASSLVFRETANAAVYTGQYKPQRIFDVFAWKQFIEAWKRGDFKNKKQ
ncbi:MAG: carboxypeptidase-like regulatory domain-containing protein [Saprospiraceae bacterium]|nr:carboxypeptidase-like regulatory domain-containing protein [Saprospiraceae bacterium]